MCSSYAINHLSACARESESIDTPGFGRPDGGIHIRPAESSYPALNMARTLSGAARLPIKVVISLYYYCKPRAGEQCICWEFDQGGACWRPACGRLTRLTRSRRVCESEEEATPRTGWSAGRRFNGVFGNASNIGL